MKGADLLRLFDPKLCLFDLAATAKDEALEEMLIAPIPNSLILAGYISGGVARGLAVGLMVTVVALLVPANCDVYTRSEEPPVL